MWRPWLGTLAAVLLISQSAFAQGTDVEVAVSTNPRDECATKVRLRGGQPVDFTVAKTGKVARLTQPYTCACITQRGDVTYSYCPEAPSELPAFIPGGVVPVAPCISPGSPNCGKG
jgi:hypothetical protein